MGDLAAQDRRIGVTAKAPPLSPVASVIDRAHLGRMTHGERDLEREVLQLFATQADLLLGRMCPGGPASTTPAAIAAMAHTLSGSSRGIGAWQVAAAAAALEADAAEGYCSAAALDRLASAVRAAQYDIAELIAGR